MTKDQIISASLAPETAYSYETKNIGKIQNQITIIAEVHNRFDVVIPADELGPENFNSARALYALITRLEDE